MDIIPRTPAHGQYNHLNNLVHHHNFHHHTDQTKSLQELQNEVGALLEFRDLVIETFPDLKHKMASSGANSTITGLQSSSIVSRREWEPGIRVRRKLNNNLSKDGSSNASGTGEIQSSSLLIRSRSNSHSGKKEPKSGGEGNGSVIQDSGFSTETSSSKEAHSASSTAGSAGAQGNNISSALTARLSSDSSNDNELWNLLDVIHRRTSRLADEIDNYQKFSNRNVNGQATSAQAGTSSFQSQLNFMSKEDVQNLRKERDHLMDKMGDMEAEFLASRIKESKLHEQLQELQQTKVELEDQLKLAMSQKLELSRMNDLQDCASNQLISPDTSKSRFTSNDTLTSSSIIKNRPNSTFQPIPIKPQKLLKASNADDSAISSTPNNSKQLKDELNQLGRLDGLISNPNSKLNKVRVPDSKKIAAILLETNIVELQRHLLTITVQNQVLQQRLEQATKSKIYLIKKLDKSKEDVEDLKFQIEERNIELEGTRAQLRVMESKLANRSDLSPDHQSSSNVNSTKLSSHDGITIMHTSTPNRLPHSHSQTISTPSMKAMVPLAMDEAFQNSSSTESAHDQQERELALSKCPETPKRSKPSKIPLPGTKGFIAKPPSGRPPINGPPSNKSLTKSTSSLYNGQKSSGPSSITKKDTSLTRPDSVQSWRNMSLEGKNRSSSIPISNKPIINVASSSSNVNSSPNAASYGTTIVNVSPSTTSVNVNNKYVTSSPVPRHKRDSLTTKVKNLDSLSRLQSSSTGALMATSSGVIVTRSPTSPNAVTNNGTNNRKFTALPVRRMSNVSVGRENDIHDNSSSGETNGGKAFRKTPNPFAMQSNVIKKSWTTPNIRKTVADDTRQFMEASTPFQSHNLIREYLLKTRVPEILKLQQNRRPSPTFVTSAMTSDMNIAYKHPLVIAEELRNGGGEALAIDNSSIIVPKPIRQVKKKTNHDERPHLIGKVNPMIARTWEQLSNQMDLSSESNLEDNDEDDKQSYVLFVRKPFNFLSQDDDNFSVNKIQHDASEIFFDSIDNDEEEDEDEESCPEGGETMAEELDSLEIHCNNILRCTTRKDLSSSAAISDISENSFYFQSNLSSDTLLEIMTELYEDDSLVKVRAQVMTRDESTEGWLPLQGGGLANVSIRKRARMPDVGGHEYIIYGQRISDQTVILSCVINRDLQYYKVMPTFHHWRAGKQRNGLTFQTAADARAFDKGIIKAYDDLIDGLSQKTNWHKHSTSTHTDLYNYDDTQVGEDDVFMTLDLPIETSESKSSSEGTGSNQSVEKQPSSLQQPAKKLNIQYISCELAPNNSNNNDSNSQHQLAPVTQPSVIPADNYSYVQLTAVHDYNYPVAEDPITSVLRRDSTCSLKKRTALEVPESIIKENAMIKARLRCRYCQEFYQEEWNRRGSCAFAPDCIKSGIDTISGMICARCMLYHCMSDSEGELINHPCSCSSNAAEEVSCTKRWIGLALLSLLVPCLWCYPPLKACHMIGIQCGVCGGKHKPQI
ncbi:CLUMA_CG018239, isoform B [Clunio marinus]|uniref:CLUMA_CG018239, isoform B n=1 Tax=Clunio marinus TaxID=568069 RepID=A0A1J1IZZ6_9DIPT|nr:CLUMA_CG018239, isoform B [Clunio marinus]